MEQKGTNQRAKGRNWMGTCNNPELKTEEYLKKVKDCNGVVYVVG